jgi:transcriptional regulator with XRE-family HTH domain
MALTAGPQLRAARAMARLGQDELAELAGVAPATIKRLEGAEGELRAHRTTLRALQAALEKRGIEFLPGGGLRPHAPATARA